jgi:hypothetical protein
MSYGDYPGSSPGQANNEQLTYRYAPGRAKRWRVVRGRRAVRGGFRHAPAHAVEPLWASAVPRRGALDRRAAEAGRVPRDPEHCAETEGARGTGKSRRAYRGPAHTGLLFLKMADERTKAPYNQKSPVPEKYSWPSLAPTLTLPRKRGRGLFCGDELFDQFSGSRCPALARKPSPRLLPRAFGGTKSTGLRSVSASPTKPLRHWACLRAARRQATRRACSG